ncbi:MAG: STAS domain-containing protein [Deltaproteobacteria bacterium]|nr:STAS domain-containing protein [Deltaproteobacteria bacterium]
MRGDIASIETWDSFSRDLTAVIDSGVEKLVLDLDKVTYLNSSALGSIVAAQRTSEERRGEIIPVNVSTRLMRFFELYNLTEILKIE